MNIFEIDQKYLILQQMLEESEGTITEEIDTFLKNDSTSIEGKWHNYVKMIRYFKGQQSVVEVEIKRLTKIKRTSENSIERLKNILSDSMHLRQIDKYDGSTFKLSFRKSSSVEIDDINVVPLDYIKIVASPDKVSIKKALDSGEVVPGVHLEEKQNLQIK